MYLRGLMTFVVFSMSALIGLQVNAGGRYEINMRGQEFWLPDWMSSQVYSEFQKELIALHEKSSAPNSVQQLQCENSYKKLFDKSDIRWSIYYGYGDGDDESFTTDITERSLLEKEITYPCPEGYPNIQFCGFTKSSDPRGQFQKKILTKQKKWVTIHLNIFNPSVSPDLLTNSKNPQQIRKSKELEKSFLQAIHTEDILFYSGHARHGTGPGFRPLAEQSKDWWIAMLFRPMMARVNSTMNPRSYTDEPLFHQQKPSPKIMGLFSCESEGHYGVQLTQNSPDSGLIMARQTISALDNMRMMYAAANSLITETCEDQFQKNLGQALKTIYFPRDTEKPRSYKNLFPKIFNFFQPNQIKNQNDLLMYFRNQDLDYVDITGS